MLRPQTYETCHLPPEIGRVFQIEGVLSEKAHRAVYVAKEVSSGDRIVIKRLTPNNDVARWRSALREVKFLRYLNHDKIISIRDIRMSFDCGSLTDIYLVQELMATDLQHIIATHSISQDDCQLLIGQLLCAVKVMHSAGILHRDIKPSNILLDAKCHLKVGDLSLARSVVKVADKPERVSTLQYRAPEIMLSYGSHTKAVDIWSVGCVLAEMLGGKQIFAEAASIAQLNAIFSVLGTPASRDISWISLNEIRETIRNLAPRKKMAWKGIFPKASDGILDLLEKLLTFNPLKRISAAEALEHPFFKSCDHLVQSSDIATASNGMYSFDAETDSLTQQQLESEFVW